ncbi:FkbM family methyltransferase [Mycobacterium sp. M1]|uniref:FkbM family methyltransferase n=1 Tax=Mycolicibacter acidiphilus TaxID=2835306 RepID=A0ABS5RIT6_9MYCO|nr:FkbM family methyltransferase [Mycolicibacter acidiphilus]MBS9533514.1 FkbM family methyltransferase [Mycolicibacter acidiphilus]
MSVKDSVVGGDLTNWAAKYATMRNLGRLFGCTAMGAATEVLWRRRRAGDLAMAVADHFAVGGATVLDVGASWGLFTYHLARRVGASGQVCSFEPHPDNAPMLSRLAAARSNVQFHPVAASDVAGIAQLCVPEQQGRLVTAQASLAHGFDGQGVNVQSTGIQTVRLDDAIPAGIDVDFVKIDVEGHEQAVLRGGSAMLQRCRPAILIEIEQRHLSVPIAEVFSQLEALGYQLFFITESALHPIAHFDVHRHQMSMVASGEFHPFAMPDGYVHDFCAVPTRDALGALPVCS